MIVEIKLSIESDIDIPFDHIKEISYAMNLCCTAIENSLPNNKDRFITYKLFIDGKEGKNERI